MKRMGRPKTIENGKQLVTRVEAEHKDKLECLADRLDTNASNLVREAIEALLEANPVPPTELDTWRRRQKQRSRGGVVGLKRPRGSIALGVALTWDDVRRHLELGHGKLVVDIILATLSDPRAKQDKDIDLLVRATRIFGDSSLESGLLVMEQEEKLLLWGLIGELEKKGIEPWTRPMVAASRSGLSLAPFGLRNIAAARSSQSLSGRKAVAPKRAA